MTPLQTMLTIQHMAERASAISAEPGADEGAEMAAAYFRLHAQTRAGLSDEETATFDELLPEPNPEWGTLARAHGDKAFHMATAGRQARVMLEQLAGWCAGQVAALVTQAKIDAEIAAANKPATGFGRKAA